MGNFSNNPNVTNNLDKPSLANPSIANKISPETVEHLRSIISLERLEVPSADSIAFEYPLLSNLKKVKSANLGGDACIAGLTPEQAIDVVDLCKKRNLPLPEIENYQEHSVLNFKGDHETRERVLFRIGVHKVSDNARDPDFRGADPDWVTFFKKAANFFHITTETPKMSYADVAKEMQNFDGNPDYYLRHWHNELLENIGCLRGSDYLATRILIKHLDRLKNMELLSDVDLKRWEPAIARYRSSMEE